MLQKDTYDHATSLQVPNAGNAYTQAYANAIQPGAHTHFCCLFLLQTCRL